MERTLEIKAQFSGVISTGSYENEKPLFEIKETIQANGETDAWIEGRQSELYEICRRMFKKVERDSIVQRIQKERQDIRFYQINGEQYPSVTSIIGWDADFFVSPEQLIQYAARGSIIHKRVELFIKTGEWKNPKDIPECYPDLVILKKGSMKLDYDDVDFLEFIKNYPIEFVSSEVTVYNHEQRYAGRQDFVGIPIIKKGNGWDKMGVSAVPTIFDVKTGTIDEPKNFKQLTAYWHCKGNEDVGQIMIIPLNNKTQQGYSKPKVCNEKDKYWSLFLEDRKNFIKRFQL